MRKTTKRYVMRCALVGLFATVSALQASAYGSTITGSEVVDALLSGVLLSLSYAGIGYATPVEPHIGNK